MKIWQKVGVGVGIFLLFFTGCSRKLDLKEFHPVPVPIAKIKPPSSALEHRTQPVAVIVEPTGERDKRRKVEREIGTTLGRKPFISVVAVEEGKLSEKLKTLPTLFPSPKYLIVIRNISSRVGVRCSGFGCPDWVTSLSQLPSSLQSREDIPPEVEVLVKGKIAGALYSLPEMKEIALVVGECRDIETFPYRRDYSREINYRIFHKKSKTKIYFYKRPPLPDLSRLGCLPEAVLDLSRQVWQKLAPLGYVLEIRRNRDGDFVAKVNLGERDGVREGEKVYFFHLNREPDPLRNRERVEWQKIGEGEISNQTGFNFSWVWIDDHTRLPEVGDIVKPIFRK